MKTTVRFNRTDKQAESAKTGTLAKRKNKPEAFGELLSQSASSSSIYKNRRWMSFQVTTSINNISNANPMKCTIPSF